MDKKSQFKEFVKKNPELINFVKKDEMTWQKFYEIYDLYGENDSVWNKYIKSSEVVKDATILDALSWIKKINLDKVEESINSVQRVIGVLEDFKSNNKEKKEEYKPRPLYKHFED